MSVTTTAAGALVTMGVLGFLPFQCSDPSPNQEQLESQLEVVVGECFSRGKDYGLGNSSDIYTLMATGVDGYSYRFINYCSVFTAEYWEYKANLYKKVKCPKEMRVCTE